MIVADCTTICYLLLPCEHTPAVESLLKQDPYWVSVSLWEAEFASVLSKHEKHKGLLPAQSNTLITQALRLLGHTQYCVPMIRVLDTARRTGCSTYDSHYIALAEDLDVTLYTFDEEVLRKCPLVARKPSV